jgi:urease accessory protein
MIASASAVVAPGGRLRHVSSQPPLTLRQLSGAPPGTCALGLVGTAAGPLAGDVLTLALAVDAHAQASLAAAGASIAQGRGAAPATLQTSVSVGAGGYLDADPGPLIVCAGAAVRVRLDIELADTAGLVWREVLVFGRTGEPGGAARLDWNVTRAGRAVLRQTLDLTDPARTSWPGALGRYRTVVTELRVGAFDAVTVVHGRADVTQRLGDGATLRTTLR